MLFNSQAFIVLFLPVVAALYYVVAGNRTARQLLIVAASLGFYGNWDVRFVPLLMGLTEANWAIAAWFGRVRDRDRPVRGVDGRAARAEIATHREVPTGEARGAQHAGGALGRPSLDVARGVEEVRRLGAPCVERAVALVLEPRARIHHLNHVRGCVEKVEFTTVDARDFTVGPERGEALFDVDHQRESFDPCIFDDN